MVETQLCKLRDTSDTRHARGVLILYQVPGTWYAIYNMVFVNY